MFGVILSDWDIEGEYYGDPGDSRLGYLHPGFQNYWFAPGARPPLHVPGLTEGRGSVFKAHSETRGNLRYKKAYMEPTQWDSWEGRWGKKNIQNQKNKLLSKH